MRTTFKCYLIILFCATSIETMGQDASSSINDSTKTHLSSVVIKKAPEIDRMIETYESSFKQEGYRIQIFQGNKKQPAREAKSKYISIHSKHKAHEIYQQPYFKVRVGDFRTKLEALKFQKELASNFPNSFIVKDEIEVEELLDN